MGVIETPAKASQIIERARSVSDLPASRFISHVDEQNSLNEAWKDIYSKLTDSDDDYYVTDGDLTLSSIYAVANHSGEYLIPLPADFYKLRYLDFQAGNVWRPMQRFTTRMRGYRSGDPLYRIKGSYLWIVWSNNGTAASTIRIGYYPPPATVTVPDTDKPYGTSVAPNSFSLVTSPGWASVSTAADVAFYVYNAQTLKSESIANNTVAVPITLKAVGANISNLVYYKGYVYWLQAADIYRVATDLVTPIVAAATQLTATANVTSFAIFVDLIYFSPGATIKTCNLDGSSVSAALIANAGSWMCSAASLIFYVDGSNNLKTISPSAVVLANITAAVTDGTYLYVLDTTYNLKRLTFTAGALSKTETLRTDVATIGPVFSGRVPFKTKEAQTFLAMDTTVDYTFTYPSNLVPEIMAYQSAIDYRAKQTEDTEELKTRLVTLWSRFEQVVKRDEYSVDHIANVYDQGSWGWPL